MYRLGCCPMYRLRSCLTRRLRARPVGGMRSCPAGRLRAGPVTGRRVGTTGARHRAGLLLRAWLSGFRLRRDRHAASPDGSPGTGQCEAERYQQGDQLYGEDEVPGQFVTADDQPPAAWRQQETLCPPAR
jgi:hypothetical protein